MTLSVDEVRNIRFPMARKPSEDGYRASAVDNFIDRLEVSYVQLVDENERLREAASMGEGTDDSQAHETIQSLESEKVELERAAEVLREENGQLLARNEQLQAEVDQLRTASDELRGQVEEAERNKNELMEQIEELGRARNDLQSKVDEAALGSDDLQRQLAEVAREREVLQSEVGQLRNEAAQATDEHSEYAAVVAAPVVDTAELDELRGRCEHLQDQNEQLLAELTQTRAELESRPEAAALAPAIAGDYEPYRSVSEAQHIVVTAASDASPAVIRLVELATQQADAVVTESQAKAVETIEVAQTEATRLVEEANSEAQETTGAARSEAERLQREAQESAERTFAEAKARADALDGEVADRRTELFTELEYERDDLSNRVGQLRDFESNYRSTMAAHLQSQIEALNDSNFTPASLPSLLEEVDDVASDTPRLDALLVGDDA